jgi:hypothetical protein
MTAFVNGPIGAKTDRVTAGTTTDGALAEFGLGTRAVGADGNIYLYVQAGEAISTATTEPYGLAISSVYQAVKVTAATGAKGHTFGVAPRQIIADNAFFWAVVHGTCSMRVTASAAADAVLGLGGVGAAGRLASSVTASAGNIIVYGVKLTAAASASASAGNTIRTAILTHPIFRSAVAD